MTEVYATLPNDLKNCQNWVMWRLTSREGKPTKIPFSIDGGMASSTDPATWTDFDSVKNIEPTKTGGIGFTFDGNGIIGIDLDHCLLENGTVDPKFSHITEQLKTYTEISPSGTGLHLFIRCNEKPYSTGRKKGNVEIYSEGRYFTVTGSKWGECPLEIREYPAALIRELLDPFLCERKPAKVSDRNVSLILDDKSIIEIATRADNGKKFDALMKGNTTDYQSDSEADAALASLLSFYTTNSDQIERIMRSSRLTRKKWDENSGYMERTIASAMALVTNHYDPKQLRLLGEVPKKRPELSDPKAPNIENPRLIVNLPHNFVQKYIDYINGLSDSYPEYQHGAALMLLSLAVNKHASLSLNIGTIYPNLWVFCLGQSTVSRKTTACTKLTEFIELQNQWMILSYPGSPEAFIEDLEGEGRVSGPENIGHGILCRDEAGGILSAMEKTYMADMRDLFCQLYDCRPFTRKLRTSQRKIKTTFNIRNTYLCMFSLQLRISFPHTQKWRT